MELVLLDPPASGYNAGDDVSGLLQYNIASEQKTVYDVRLDFDGSVMINPIKFKYETHRSNTTLIEDSRTLFQGPFTMKRQLLVWPFSFKIPATAVTRGAEVPLPPTMDFLFREGLRVNVRYSITATIRFGSDGVFGNQETRLVYVKPSTTITTLHSCSNTISFPTMEFQTSGGPELSRSSIWDFFTRSEIASPPLQQTLHLELKAPSALLYDQQEHISCCLSGTTDSGNTLSDPKFTIETFELVLRSCLTWQNHLQIRQHIGTLTTRPGTEVHADGQFVSLPHTFQLQDFADQEETRVLQSYDSVIPQISLGFTLTAIVVLRHEISGQHLIFRASFPVVLHGSTASSLSPPAYRDHEALEESGPPPYA